MSTKRQTGRYEAQLRERRKVLAQEAITTGSAA